MKVEHVCADSVESLVAQLPRQVPEHALVLCYATGSAQMLAQLCQAVQSWAGRHEVIGLTTEQPIVNGHLSESACVVSILQLEAQPEVMAHGSLDEAAGAVVDDWLAQVGAEVVLTWQSGSGVQVDAFWQARQVPVRLLGGVVGLAKNGDQCLWQGGDLIPTGGVLVGLQAVETRFETDTLGGWAAVTPPHRVTRAEGGRIYEIDHQSMLAFYQRYLGIGEMSPAQLFEIGLAFPLLVTLPSGQRVIRGVIEFHDDGSVTCVGTVSQGAWVQLAVGSVSRLLSHSGAMCSPHEGALVFFCMGRRLRLGDQVERALAPFSHCGSSGFLSYGELSVLPDQPPVLLNHTTVYLTARGRDATCVQPPSVARPMPDTSDLLVNLLTRVHDEHARLERLLTLASHLVVVFERHDARWEVQRVMGKVALTGYDTDQLLNHQVDLFEQLDSSGRTQLEAFLKGQTPWRKLHVRLRQSGDGWRAVSLLLLKQADRLLWLVEDLSDREALQRIYEMFERGPVVQFEWGAAENWPIHYVSPNVTQVLGLPYEDLASGQRHFSDFIHPEDLPHVQAEVGQYLNEAVEDFQQEYRIVAPDGRLRWVRDYTHVIYDERGRADTIYGFVIDITREKRALLHLEKEKAQAAWRAMHDPLTGLYNRAYLNDRFPVEVNQARRRGMTPALLFIDLDNFKEINDVHGHSVGDEILRQFAQRLKALLRAHDLTARFGGDEFVVLALIDETDSLRAADKVRVLAEKVLMSLEAPFEVNGDAFRLSASVGIVLVDETRKEDFETLIRYADTSMYLAKRAGRNGYRFFDETQQKQEEARAQKLTALRQAIDREELWLAYQPQVRWDEAAGRFELCGAEVLMRWQSEQFGFVSPGEFIPLAEDTGYILTLGDWMVETAIGQLARWQRDGLLPRDFVLSLNISAVQFYQPDFVERLLAVCQAHDVAPTRVRLELTERIIYKGSESALKLLRHLRGHGFSTSLDDFGTGYSSLAYLKQLDLDELKIDQTFVRNFLKDRSNAVLTRTIIDLAHNFELLPIAEGTEHAEEVCALIQMGCSTFQGYFFGRPMSAADFADWAQGAPLAALSLEGC